MTSVQANASKLFIAAARRTRMRPVDHAMAIANKGFEGCVHGRPGSRRQVLLVAAETLAEFNIQPGILRENITTEGLRHDELTRGQRLSIGDALLEVTGACTPCGRMDEIRMGLQAALRGRRGTLCRVLAGGAIRRGDSIGVAAPDFQLSLMDGRNGAT